jgi:hypothetical protein
MARTRDISADGVFVEVRLSDPRWAVTVGDILQLSFRLPNGGAPIEAAGMVTRVERDAIRLVRGIGIHFRGLGAWERSTIADFVETMKLDQMIMDRLRPRPVATLCPDP